VNDKGYLAWNAVVIHVFFDPKVKGVLLDQLGAFRPSNIHDHRFQITVTVFELLVIMATPYK